MCGNCNASFLFLFYKPVFVFSIFRLRLKRNKKKYVCVKINGINYVIAFEVN